MGLSSICNNISRKKTFGDQIFQSDLKKCLSLTDLTFLAIGAMVGGGLYVMTGTIAHDVAGPSVILSYAIAAVASGLSAICYAEFSARIPVAGSAYQFTYFSIGEFWAFMIGWNVLIEHIVTTSAIAKTWSANFDHAIGNVVRNYLLEHCPMATAGNVIARFPDFIAIAVLIISMVILLSGAKMSSTVNASFAGLNLIIITTIIVTGCYLGSTKNWTEVEGGFFPYGLSGTMSGAASLIFAYVGYEVVASASEEAKNPKRDIPLSLLVALTAVVIAYVGASSALTLMVPYKDIDTGAPFPSAYQHYGWQWARYLVTVGALISIFAPLISTQYVAPRYLMAMARDGLLMPMFAKVHDTTKVPFLSTVITGIVSIVLATVFQQRILVEFISIGQLLACTFVAFCVIKLRYEPNNLSYQRMDDGIVTPDAVSKLNPATENTPLRKIPLRKSVTGDDSNLSAERGASVDSSSTDEMQLTQLSPEDVAVGALKESVLNSAFGSNPMIQWVARHSPGTVPYWLLLVSAASGFISITIGVFGHIHSSGLAIAGTCIFGLISLFAISCLLLFNQDASIKSFKVPIVPFLPFTSAVINIILILSLQPTTWLRFVVWLSIGVLIYCAYGYKNSNERRMEQA